MKIQFAAAGGAEVRSERDKKHLELEQGRLEQNRNFHEAEWDRQDRQNVEDRLKRSERRPLFKAVLSTS